MKCSRIVYWLLASALVISPGCGDSETSTPPANTTACGEGTEEVAGVCVPTGEPLDCGDGTFESAGECIPFDPNDSTAPTTSINPTGGRFRTAPSMVTLTADEPAMIHVTVDGSDPANAAPVPSPATVVQVANGTQVRYFAVDPAGNAEAEQTATFTLDSVGTNAVSDLTAAVTAPGNVELSWTNPSDADFGGVVVARVLDSIDGRPVDGQTHAVGDALSPHLEVVYAGNAETFSETQPIGVTEYAVWAHDDLANYSRRKSTAAVIPLPPQTATLSIDMANSTVTATTPFAHLNISGTFVFNNGSSATLRFAVENTTTRTLHSPKLVFTNPSEGTVNNSDGTLDGGQPFHRLTQESNTPGAAPTAIGAGSTRQRTISVSGVTATSVVTVDVELLTNPALVVSDWNENSGMQLVDARSTSNPTLARLRTPTGLSGAMMRAVCSHISNSGRYAYMYHRNHGAIIKLDLLTGDAAQSLMPAHGESQAHVSMMHFNPADEYLYALFVDGNHSFRYGDGTRTSEGLVRSRGTDVTHHLLRIDPDTLEEVGRVTLQVPEARFWGVWSRGFAISPDGTQAAIGSWSHDVKPGGGDKIPRATRPYASWVNIVDLATMTELDRDAATAGVQPMDVSPLIKPRALVYHPAGTHLYVGTKAWNDNDSADDLNDIQIPVLVKVDLSDDTVTVLENGDCVDNSLCGYTAMTAHPDGSIWMAGENGNGIDVPYGPRILDTANDATTPAPGTLTWTGTFAVLFSADGARAYVPSYTNDIHVFDVATKAELSNQVLARDSYGHQLCVTPF